MTLILDYIHGFSSHLRRDRAGNIIMILAFALIPLTFAIGFAADYSNAQRIQSQLNAIADSAVLAGVGPAMISKTDAEASATVTAMFNSQAATIPGVSSYTLIGPTITNTTSGTLGNLRTITLSFQAKSKNFFGGVIHVQTLPISGSATAIASQPPSINFYVMMDNSPSMLLPTTSAGITQLESANGNCAFSCHTSEYIYNPISDNNGYWIFVDQNYYNVGINQTSGVYKYNSINGNVYDSNNNLLGTNFYTSNWNGRDGGTINWYASTGWQSANVYWADPYWLAENYGKAYPSSGVTSIPLRIDAELSAAQGLITTAQSTVASLRAANPSIIYSMQFLTFNYQVNNVTSAMTSVGSLTPSMIVPANGTLAPYMRGNGYYPTSLSDASAPGYYTNNSDSSPYASLASINSIMPAPGTGLPASTPQEVLMIVTDGYQDEIIGGSQIRQPWNQASLDQCTAIKARGIRIAILYTTYDPNTILPDYPYYAGLTPQILPTLQSCASPGGLSGSLVYQVSVNQDITAALASLFSMTVQTARIVQ